MSVDLSPNLYGINQTWRIVNFSLLPQNMEKN